MAVVLVVDDEEGIREALAEFLKADGHSVYTASKASQALEKVKQTEIDVVVTDIIMPEISGIELAQKLRELSPLTKSILITGRPALETATEAVRLGVFDYLSKPLDQGSVCRVVRAAVTIRKLETENLLYRWKA